MTQNPIFLLETLLFESGALAFGVWQLWTVWPKKKIEAEEPSSPEDPGHPEG